MLKQLNYLIQVVERMEGEINVCNKYTYDRKVHLKDCINQYQGKQNTNINPRIYDELEEQLVIIK